MWHYAESFSDQPHISDSRNHFQKIRHRRNNPADFWVLPRCNRASNQNPLLRSLVMPRSRPPVRLTNWENDYHRHIVRNERSSTVKIVNSIKNEWLYHLPWKKCLYNFAQKNVQKSDPTWKKMSPPLETRNNKKKRPRSQHRPHLRGLSHITEHLSSPPCANNPPFSSRARALLLTLNIYNVIRARMKRSGSSRESDFQAPTQHSARAYMCVCMCI